MNTFILAFVVATFSTGGSGVTEVPEKALDVEEVIQAVSPAQLRKTINRLDAFGTRHTFSDTVSDERGIGAARRWLRDQFQVLADASGRSDITVELMRYIQPPQGRRITEAIEIVNVVMIIPGTMPESRGRMFVVLGHYDSRNGDGMDAEGDAPGANDDGSGTAAVLELARVFSTRPGEAPTVLSMTAAGGRGLWA